MREKMPDRMPEQMPDRMPEYVPESMSEQMPDRMSKYMPERMSEIVRISMPYILSDGMSETMSEQVQGGDHWKKAFFKEPNAHDMEVFFVFEFNVPKLGLSQQSCMGTPSRIEWCMWIMWPRAGHS